MWEIDKLETMKNPIFGQNIFEIFKFKIKKF